MARKKVQKNVTDVDLEEEISVQAVDDAVILKVDHTHAGTMYKAGTSIEELNPSEATLEFMRVRDII